MFRISLRLLILITILTTGVLTVSASSFTTGTLVQVTGNSPFAGCTADNVAAQSGTNYLNSEVEPWVDVNPINPLNIVGAVQQDRWSNGGARGLVAPVSFDGGLSWTTVVIPDISLCSGGDYDRATDPWVSFGPDGVVYQLALSFNDVNPPFEARDFDHALLASYSQDGGLTWTQPVVVRRDLDANVFNDKQSITADPYNANFVYAAWDRLVFPTSERANVIAGFVSASYRGPTWFARTTDGGDTWEPAHEIYDPGQNNGTIGNQIVVLPDGTLINGFDLIKKERSATATGAFYNVALIRSDDKGGTWGPQKDNGKMAPIVISPLRTIFITDPETGIYVRTADIIPDFAVDSNSGALYAVWQDARPNSLQADAIVLSMSTDGGFTWTAPIKVNQTPTNIPIGNQQAFTPSVDVSADGTVAVTYYDFRNNTTGASLLTDYFVAHCHSACDNASNWTQENRLTNTSFDMTQAPDAGGFFTGDYAGLASAGTSFGAFFSQPHGSDPSSVFFRKIGP